ncbi:hypothetical protein SAMN02745126_01607 [Enhydrobacter aerosaccus]|uniref:Uncharacterized protein n=1 Tax=Enhydrobacter aerosaccus TaxID=225324 RepID=A0A1T4LLK2_9HYPH|nr:hypothetical protein [Enhydrobacter aerosaccus]SJZ55612.1 hypothetical protein SAMN02745126_01607 [Enhydrobacter aerosaccus]
MQPQPSDVLIQLVPLMLIQLVLLFAVVPLALKASRRAWAWIVFAVIPIFGLLAIPILVARALAGLIGRVDALSSQLDLKRNA